MYFIHMHFQTGRMKSRIRKVRLVLAHSLAFVILWNAFGLSNVYYSIVRWDSIEIVPQTTVKIIRIVGFIFSVVNPFILFYFNRPIDDKCDFRNCLVICKCTSNAETEPAVRNVTMELEMSKFGTIVAETEATSLIKNESRKTPKFVQIIVTSPSGQDIRLNNYISSV